MDGAFVTSYLSFDLFHLNSKKKHDKLGNFLSAMFIVINIIIDLGILDLTVHRYEFWYFCYVETC